MKERRYLSLIKNYILCFILINTILLIRTGLAQNPSDHVTNDWEQTEVGLVRQVIVNSGHITGSHAGYPGLLKCRYIPAPDDEKHLGYNGLWISGITPEGDERVSVGAGISSVNEMWPTSNEWDSVWVVNQGDTVDIGGITPEGEEDFYLQNYTPLSDQDIISRYNDYKILTPSVGGNLQEAHRPLYIDVIQTAHTWSASPVDDIVLYQFNIIPTKFSLESVYLSVQYRSKIGKHDADPKDDDRVLYLPEQQMIASEDGPGGSDGNAYAAVGYQFLPPDDIPVEYLNWSFIWGTGNAGNLITGIDAQRYNDIIASGQIMENQQFYRSATGFFSVGPYDVALGDTLTMRLALVLGKGLDGLIENANTVLGAEENDFKFPKTPPPPKLQTKTSSKQVRLTWEDNAEQYEDKNRTDGVTRPFEGYRVYKSTISKNGPWTPLAQFDKPGDEYGLNNGLQNEYVDVGLLNNIQYYYSVVAFSQPDTLYPWPSVESSIHQNAVEVTPGSGSPKSVGKVAVVPNPYRGDINYYEYNPPWEQAPPGRPWMKQDRRVQFINLPSDCVIKVFSASGDFIKKIEHHDPNKGYEDWNLTSYVDQAIASGMYFFTVKALNSGETQVGKFVVIK